MNGDQGQQSLFGEAPAPKKRAARKPRVSIASLPEFAFGIRGQIRASHERHLRRMLARQAPLREAIELVVHGESKEDLLAARNAAVASLPAHPRLSVRSRRCRRGCAACPHPLYVLDGTKHFAKPKALDLRATGIRDTRPFIQAIREASRLDRDLRTRTAASERDEALFEQAWRRLNGLAYAYPWLDEARFTIGEFVPIVSSAGAIEEVVPLALVDRRVALWTFLTAAVIALTADVQMRNLLHNRTLRLRLREGMLGLHVRTWQSLPPTAEWRVYVRGEKGKWIGFDTATRVRRTLSGASVRQVQALREDGRLTRQGVRKSGNAKLETGYQRADEALRELLAIRSLVRPLFAPLVCKKRPKAVLIENQGVASDRVEEVPVTPRFSEGPADAQKNRAAVLIDG